MAAKKWSHTATGVIAAPSNVIIVIQIVTQNSSRATAPVAFLFMNMFQQSNK